MSDLLSLTPDESTALWLSLKVGLWATLVSVLPALAVAWLLARRRFWGHAALDILVHLPLVLPPVVTGYLLLLLLGRKGLLGAWLDQALGLRLAFSWSGAALAAAVMGFPLFVRAIRLSLEAVDRRLEEAAATLGAPRLWIFLTITLPLLLPGLLAGAILAFARALGEFGATITFAGAIPGETQTLASAAYLALQVPNGEPSALRLTLLAVALSVAALVASELLARRMRQRSGQR